MLHTFFQRPFHEELTVTRWMAYLRKICHRPPLMRCYRRRCFQIDFLTNARWPLIRTATSHRIHASSELSQKNLASRTFQNFRSRKTHAHTPPQRPRKHPQEQTCVLRRLGFGCLPFSSEHMRSIVCDSPSRWKLKKGFFLADSEDTASTSAGKLIKSFTAR